MMEYKNTLSCGDTYDVRDLKKGERISVAVTSNNMAKTATKNMDRKVVYGMKVEDKVITGLIKVWQTQDRKKPIS